MREFTYLAEGGFSVEGDGHKYRPWGFDGGTDGETASLTLIDRSGAEQGLVSKVPYYKAKAGDRLCSQGPCGGGYGNPFERDPDAVLADVLDGYISASRAASDYGAVLQGGVLDREAMARHWGGPSR